MSNEEYNKLEQEAILKKMREINEEIAKKFEELFGMQVPERSYSVGMTEQDNDITKNMKGRLEEQIRVLDMLKLYLNQIQQQNQASHPGSLPSDVLDQPAEKLPAYPLGGEPNNGNLNQTQEVTPLDSHPLGR